ncbi:dinuclear metal center YbgI/SA1388 family protein [Bacillus ectoiniformans]|uniref:Nif3-like dinuclear metal center hexameric protein n=1 Tax=Bacillus ectoiniformans TaxID=1494429 RepID=UPI0019583976|nr:Nif3-like dinuclear metal center hexameric protein [Bacillus ectoiniformans]MBM7650016.1 dinuclear metal center YbgI/SA1388 family protein [Bacillus ectoiniformans]
MKKKIANGQEIIQLFEQFSPKKYAMEGDKIGLQVGSLNKPVNKVLVALDVLEEVVDEAIEIGAQLIIAHHPIIFRPLKSIVTSDPAGRLLEKLIKNDIAVYAAHTNLDVAKGGVNDWLADALELHEREVLVPTYEEELKKLAVYVPKSHEAELRIALGQAGAGYIGEYSHCSFSTEGTGRFVPTGGAEPYLGSVGQLEEVQEVKIETIYPKHVEKKILTAMLKAHPYEEVAYDVYALENSGEELGLGRIGKLPKPMKLREFAEFVKEKLDVKAVRVVGDLESEVKKAAVLGGDGNKYFQSAKFKGADVYVTGDFYYHTAHDALAAGLNVVDPGHNVEKVMKAGTAHKMSEMAKERGFETEFIASEINTDPFTFI